MAERPPTPAWMKPLWVRLLLVAAPAAWAGFELLYGDRLWAALFAAVAAWGLWTLVIKQGQA
jgi:hypothetical protein